MPAGAVNFVCYLLSAICYLLSAICYLLSAICYLEECEMSNAWRSFWSVAVILSILAGNVNAAITITTPPNGLSSPVMTRNPINGGAQINCNIGYKVQYKPVGGTLSTLGTGTTFNSNTTSWTGSIGNGVWTGIGTYYYGANSASWFTQTRSSTLNICIIP